MAVRPENGLRGGLPSPALPGSGPWGSPTSLSAVRPLSRPVATPVTRRLVRSSSLDHLADNTHAARRHGRTPRAESPGMHGPNVVSPAQAQAPIRPVPGVQYGVLGRQPRPARLRTVRVSGGTRGLAGRRRSCFQDPGRKIIHWWSLSAACQVSMACRESITTDRILDAMTARAAMAGWLARRCPAAEYTFLASSAPPERPFSQLHANVKSGGFLCYLWEKRKPSAVPARPACPGTSHLTWQKPRQGLPSFTGYGPVSPRLGHSHGHAPRPSPTKLQRLVQLTRVQQSRIGCDGPGSGRTRIRLIETQV
jgi:hypothetical protein